MPLTATEYEANRVEKNKANDFVRISPSYRVHKDKRELALKLINRAMSDPDLRKPFDRP